MHNSQRAALPPRHLIHEEGPQGLILALAGDRGLHEEAGALVMSYGALIGIYARSHIVDLAQSRHLATIAVIDKNAHSTGISAIADRQSQLSVVASLARSNTVHEGYQRTITPNKNRKILSQMNHLMKMALGESSGVEIQASQA